MPTLCLFVIAHLIVLGKIQFMILLLHNLHIDAFHTHKFILQLDRIAVRRWFGEGSGHLSLQNFCLNLGERNINSKLLGVFIGH